MATIELSWNPSDPMDPGHCMDVTVMNSADVIEAGQAIGLEYPKPVTMKALLDTGASVTVISKTFANHCKRIVSAVFAKERHYACLIGRDILRNWTITFDGPSKKVIITE